MSKTAAIPMDKEIQNFLFIFTGQQYLGIYPLRWLPVTLLSEESLNWLKMYLP